MSMRTVIVGCGRVGAMLAVMLDDGGHQVSVLDISTAAFDRLPSTFKGNALRGDGTDEDTLRRAGAEDADLFLAMTEGDNRNIMAAQLAAEEFRVGQVIAKINDGNLWRVTYAEDLSLLEEAIGERVDAHFAAILPGGGPYELERTRPTRRAASASPAACSTPSP